jgi:hypothetical protein
MGLRRPGVEFREGRHLGKRRALRLGAGDSLRPGQLLFCLLRVRRAGRRHGHSQKFHRQTGRPLRLCAGQRHARIGGGIDATLFEDDDGSVYFTSGGAGSIRKMLPDLSGFDGPAHNIQFEKPADGSWTRNNIAQEGASLFKHNGIYYLGGAVFIRAVTAASSPCPRTFLARIKTGRKPCRAAAAEIISKARTVSGIALISATTTSRRGARSRAWCGLILKRMATVAPGVFLVDFGRVAFGNLRLIPPANATGSITVRFGEALADGRINRNPPGSVRYAQAGAVLDGAKPSSLCPGWPTSAIPPSPSRADPAGLGRGASVPLGRNRGLAGELRAEELRRRAAFASTWDDHAAAFHSSDELLNRIWELCRYSIKATTFAGVYVDGDRERISYEADAYLPARPILHRRRRANGAGHV